MRVVEPETLCVLHRNRSSRRRHDIRHNKFAIILVLRRTQWAAPCAVGTVGAEFPSAVDQSRTRRELDDTAVSGENEK